MDYVGDDDSAEESECLNDFFVKQLSLIDEKHVNSLFSHQCQPISYNKKPYDDMITDPKIFEDLHWY